MNPPDLILQCPSGYQDGYGFCFAKKPDDACLYVGAPFAGQDLDGAVYIYGDIEARPVARIYHRRPHDGHKAMFAGGRQYGYSLATTGDALWAGARHASPGGALHCGSRVYVHEATALLGTSVAVAANGDVLVGDPLGWNSGCVYVLRDGDWVQRVELPDGEYFDRFGSELRANNLGVACRCPGRGLTYQLVAPGRHGRWWVAGYSADVSWDRTIEYRGWLLRGSRTGNVVEGWRHDHGKTAAG